MYFDALSIFILVGVIGQVSGQVTVYTSPSVTKTDKLACFVIPLRYDFNAIELKAAKVTINTSWTRLTQSPVCLSAKGARFDASSYGAFKIPKDTTVAGAFNLINFKIQNFHVCHCCFRITISVCFWWRVI